MKYVSAFIFIIIKMKKYIAFIFFLFFTWTVSAQTTQWASEIINYSSQHDHPSYSAQQALAEPNSMPSKGYSATAWQASTDDRKEFLHVKFNNPMPAKMVIVAENNAPGAIYKIVLYDESGNEYQVYRERPDTLNQPSRFFYLKFDEATVYNVSEIKVSIDCRAIPGINQIDAIGIANHHNEIVSKVELVSDVKIGGAVERLSDHINTQYSEVNPVITPDGKVLFFNRKNYPPNNNDDEIWYSILGDDGEWTEAVHMPAPINNKNHNFVSAITPDGNTMLLNGQYYEGSESSGEGFALSHRTESGWSFPENAKIENYINTDRYINYYLSNDNSKVFMNVRREDTRGTSDLYVSFKTKLGIWTEPINLGEQVNSTGSECCAFLAADNTTLYFASDGYNGFGSTDIYMCRRLDDTWQKWTEPLNMGPVLNSSAWDAYYTIPASGEYAYFVRENDIYRIKLTPEVKPLPVILVSGKVYNKKTNNFIGSATINYEELPSGTQAGVARTNPADGSYKIVLPYGKKFGFLAFAEGYIPESVNIDATHLKEYTEINQDLYLVPAEVGESIRINNIFFDFAQASLQPESYPELERLYEFMQRNNKATIVLNGHTDNVGSDVDNKDLSLRRVEAVKKYLTKNGINPNRINTKGYGELMPVADNNTEEGRKLNRRVEFTILTL
jgi:OmpA-OmpF porin, OOP family